MINRICERTLIVTSLLVAIGLTTGCDSRSPAAPQPPEPPPTVTSITPSTGATGGGSSIRVVGTGFRIGASATFDGVRVTGRFDTRDAGLTTMFLETPPHSAGAVDVVVTNPDGASGRITGGFTYVPGGSFDPNRAWSAAARDGSDRTLAFTIQNNSLLSAVCLGNADEVVHLALPAPVPVVGGEFSFASADGSAMSGRIVAATEIIGTMNLGPCTAMSWKTYPPVEKESRQ